MKTLPLSLAAAITVGGLVTAPPTSAGEVREDPMHVYTVAGSDYDTVKFFLTEAIRNKGLIISGTLHVQDMLVRTAEDLGYTEGPYGKAESLEFCSAELSHQMIGVDPANLTVCPFTIAIYTLKEQPDVVHIAYEQPVLVGEGDEVEKNIRDLLDGIVTEVTEF